MGSGGSQSSYGIQGSHSTGKQSSSSSSQSNSYAASYMNSAAYLMEDIAAFHEWYFRNEYIPRWETAYTQVNKSQKRNRREHAAAKEYSLELFNDNMALIDDAIADIGDDAPALRAAMALQTPQINAAYDAAQRQTAQNLAKQNLLGAWSGANAAVNAQNERARASALSQAYHNTVMQTQAQNKEMLQNLLGLRTQNTALGLEANQKMLDTGVAIENMGATQRNALLETMAEMMPKVSINGSLDSKDSMQAAQSSSQGQSQGSQNSSSFGENWSNGSNFSFG